MFASQVSFSNASRKRLRIDVGTHMRSTPSSSPKPGSSNKRFNSVFGTLMRSIGLVESSIMEKKQ
ncbi:Hypothetical predicted protein [Pelobates cultripes]|uniref:Uncharacterized protein n=1 Tax=Pelobates cultripes TaxID=61616 RepID=A0AAD1WW60_PELCU|nr:Hypothetical predicted protein [Pelobates cultripes]